MLISQGAKTNIDKNYTSSDTPSILDDSVIYVDGYAVKRNVKGNLELVNSKSKRSAVSANRLYANTYKDNSTGRTAQLIMQAPAHYDAVRINVFSSSSEGYAWKVTVAPSASRNLRGPLDSAGANITPTVVTFGTTDRRNPRNPNGGATTVTSTGASGTAGTNTLIQDRIVSDIIQLKSLDRVDIPTNPPLIYIRVYGQNIPIMSSTDMQSTSSNSWASTCVPEFGGGFLTGDYSITNPATDFAEFGWPSVEVEFFLRGKVVRNIGVTGDSTDQGWYAATAVPFGGSVNGYMRRFVAKLRADGEAAGFSCFAYAGQKSFMSYNTAIPAVMSGELTHLVIRPFSVNDTSDGTGIAIAQNALQRTSLLINTCLEYGVVPILLRPFNNTVSTATSPQMQLVMNYCDSYKTSGGFVLDFTALLNLPGSPIYLKPEYLTYDTNGVLVDNVHLNDAAHQAIADWIYQKAYYMFT